ncbi:MAG: SDR family oxidoreductase [Bacteroidetes bacterium]|nr:SDR family oxidoreductase [Bacteroidota bacterium]
MNSNKTVLITGATSGIGFELARLFAKERYNMILVSRDIEKLEETAIILTNEGASDIIIIAKDLAVWHAAAEIYEITRKRGIKIDVLVNDAGMGEFGYFSDTDLEKELDIIQLNISSVVHLTKLYLRDMIKGRGGKILQLASVAAYQPTPRLAVYAATKAFVLSFSDALGAELRETNVTVTTLIPGATDTDFFHKAGMEHTKAAHHTEDPALVAQIGYKALMKGEAHAFAPGVRQEVFKSSLLPNRHVAIMAEKQMEEEDDSNED